MNRSDATPLHFFITGEQTYNESIADECMIDEYCYIHEWECDDIVKDQFTEEPGGAYSLLIYVDDELIGELPYDEVESGVYFISFVPSENGLCELNVVFRIRRDAVLEEVELPALTEWVNNPGTGGTDWVEGATPNVTRALLGGTDLLSVDYAFVPDAEYTITVELNSSNNATIVFHFGVGNSSFVSEFTGGTAFGTAGNYTAVLNFVANANCTRMWASATWGSNNNTTITINSVTATQTLIADQILAHTDPQRFSNDIACNTKVEFKSIKNFAGLVYDEYSEYFQMRIPGVFFHQRNPTEQKSIQISNSRVINTSAVLKKQKRFDIQDTPDYMHTKIQLIFLHAVSGSLLINGVEWTYEESYDQDDSTPDSYPLKRATTYLTRKNYVKRNVI